MTSQNRVFHKLRFSLWLFSAYLKKHFIFIFLGSIFGIIIVLQGKTLYTYLFPQIKEERIGLIGNYNQNSLPLEIQQLISFGLTKIGNDLKIFPEAAKSYEVKNGGKTYLFNLNRKLIWQDGKPFTALNVNYTFKDVKIKYDNDYTLRFDLAEPFSPFPALVTQPLFRQGLIGLGEYQVKSFENEGKFLSKLVLEKSKKRLIFKFYPTQEEGVIGFKLGEIQTVWGLNSVENIKDIKGIKITEIPELSRYVAVFFNTKNGIYQEKSFRQALNYAINDNYLTEKRVYSPISPNSWAYNTDVKLYETNLSQAEKLLEKAVPENNKKPIKIHLIALKPYEKYSWLIADSWKKLGIETKVEIVGFIPARYEALLAAQEIPLDPDQYLFWHSTSKLNITGYDNKRVDKLLEDGRQIFDLEKRKEIYFDFQKFLVEDSPAIFLYHPLTYNISRV